MRNIFTRLLVVSLLLLTTATLSAQQTSLIAGKVYKFINCSYSTKVLASNGADDTRAADAVDGEKSQHWYCETETIDGTLYYKFKNLINGRYLAGNGTSSNWPLVAGDVETDTKYFTLETSGNYNVIRSKAHANNGYAYMHSDGSYNIVGWRTDASGNATSWTISEVEYTADDIASIFGEINTMENEVAAVSTYQSYLDNIFADKACTTFKQGYVFSENESNYQALPATLKNMVKKVSSNDWTEANGDASKEEWGHKYAKKFRVQMYEPYSIADERGIISFLRFNSHANNDNPTGIYAHERGNIYVMVQGEIKQGATLRLVDAGSNDRITYPTEKGYELKTGLNILPCYGQGGHFYVCYNVETYDPDTKEFKNKLSDFEPLKIHIEGGAINGFYNAQGDFLAGKTYEGISYNEDLWKTITGASVDCDEDWEYMEARANLSVVPVLGHRQILLFSLNTTNEGDNGMAYYLPENINIPTTPYNRTGKWSDFGLGIPDEGYDGYKINIMVEAWDRIMYSELATMGLVSKDEMDKMNDLYPRWKADGSQAEMYDFNGASVVDGKTYQEFCDGRDYSEYFNHHGVALGVGGNSYMYGAGDHCGYHHNTMGGIIKDIAYTAGSTWGPAHEIGHQHQDTYLLNGQTEVTNNLFSNIALWYKGISTSRYNGNNGSLESVLNAFNTEGSDAYTNNIWALTHLYYRLWLYYHLAGKNTQFWPRLYELLRVDPLQNGGTISGDRSLLLFYKHACTAAGEDLTEFFRAHGFLSVMDNRLVGDYANAYYTVTQDMIDKAIDEVKAKGYEENLAILFINDDDETAKYVQHDGTTVREIYGETTPNSDFGSVSDFINGNVEVSTAYTASVSADGTVTMSGGEGGVGFLVLNEEGEIVSFSNKSTFAISDEAAYLLATGKATVVAVDTESNTTDAEVDVTAMPFILLQKLIENATALTEKVSETRVGFYKATAVTSLAEYVEMAEEVIATNDVANLQAVYELLYNEYNSVVTNEYSRVTLVPGSKYAITSVKSNDRILTYSGSNVTTVSGNADAYSSTDAYQWYIERDGAYYIKNAGTSKYIQDVTDQNGVLYTVGDNKVNMNINEVALGCYTIATSTVPGRYMNMDGADATRIITWGDAYSENSQWAFILLKADDTNAAKEVLLELSNKALALVNEVATISYDEGSKISLQSSDENAPNYIWSNAAVSSNNVDKLIDGNKDTYFHSQWNNSTAPADGWGHHISVDLGAGNTLASFKFKFTTRNEDGKSNYPKTIEVYGSNVGGDDVANYTKLQVASGFAAGAGVDNEAVVKGNGTAYRYLRFLVTDATGNNAGTNAGSDGMVFFHMSEFSIYPAVATVKEDYKSNITSEAVLAAYNDAESGKLVYNNASATLDDINARTTALGDGTTDGSYTTLLAQYNNVLNSEINAKKEQLQTLIDETNELISTVGSVTINPPTENELLLQVDNANVSYYLSTNSQEGSDNRNIKNLLDGVTDNADVYFHTDWETSVGADHHLLLDMGDGKSLGTFTFEYTTRNNSEGIDAPTSIVVEGSNDNSSFTTIATLTGLPTGQHRTYTSETLGTNQNKYRYVRFRVTGGAGRVGDYYYFAMSEFDVTEVTETEITVTNNSSVVEDDLLIDTYLATTKSQKLHNDATTVALLDAAIADLQAARDKLDEAIKTPAAIDKSVLQALYNEVSPYYTTVQELYASMADENGVVNENYSPSSLTNEQLATAKTALDNVQTELLAAQTVLNDATAQDAIDAAKEALNTVYEALKVQENDLLAIKNENVNLQETFDKGNINTLIDNTNILLATINGKAADYYASTTLALYELNEAFASAQDVATRYYITEEQYTTACDELNTRYTAINNVVAADVADRATLTEAIDKVNTLLAAIATTCNAENVAVPLQSTTADGEFYIWCNAPAYDSQGVAGLIDKNADGTANTGTFLGTTWGSKVDAYTHYIEVDLGEGITIDKLLFDYTTRNSNHSNQRPTAIKILGSNNKEDYTEVTTIAEGLVTGPCEQWSMVDALELGAPYRYIRFAVATQETTGFFNMSDFNLYVIPEHTFALNEYYTTATGLNLDALCIALQSAQYAAEHYLTSDRLNTVVGMLNKYYDVTNGVVEDDYTTRDGLTTLITDTEALINKVATVTEVATPELSTANVYCNADNSTHGSANAADKLGVAALFDGNVSTHLHTTYGGNEQADELDHYIRVDMGEAITAFKFSYKGRENNTNNSPTAITVQAANDVNGTWENIKELTDMVIVEGQTATYQSPYIEMNEPYRYVRIMVTDTYNHDYTTYNGKTHKFFVLSEFDIVSCPIVEVNADYPNVVAELVTDAYNEKGNATEATGYYMIEEEYNAILDELQAAYDALDIASKADKTELNNLIEATRILKNGLYETAITSYTANEITLSATEGDAGWLYCNAAESNSTWVNDNAGVAAAIDLTAEGEPNLDTFLHTEYGNDQSADGLDHYLRVDLGVGGATDYVEFGYYGRSDHEAKSPKKVIVAATNDLTDGGVWTEIATLNPAQASASTETKTGCLGNGVEYRYWRFLVEETHGGGKDGNNHQFFCMTEFNIYKCTEIVKDEPLKYTPTIYIHITTELVAEVNDGITRAEEVVGDDAANQGTVDAEVDALQAVYNKLAEALKYADVPVAITTDEENPVLYNIISKRGDNDERKMLQFDEPASDKVALVATANNASYQAWYFMKGENGYLIKPFNGDGKMLGVSGTGNAQASVSIAETATYKEWDFSRSTVNGCTDYFYIYVNGTSHACLSHNGGFDATDKLGIWSNGWNSSDGGSLFKFVEATFENNNARFYQLSDVKATMIDGTNIYGGTSVGLYTGGKEYREAYTAAGTIVTAGNTGDATECHNAYKALREAKEQLSYNAPDAEKVYYIKSAATGENTEYCQGTYVYSPNKSVTRSRGNYTGTHNHTHLLFDTMSEIGTKAHAAFQFVATDTQGSYKIKSLHTGLYVKAFTGTHMSTEAGDAATVKIAGFADGQVTLKIDNNDPMHAQQDYGVIVQWGAAAGNASLWTIDEITEIEDLTYTTTMSQLGYGTLMLGYDVKVPDGITANVATEVDGKYIIFEPVDDVIPANTAVILKSDEALTDALTLNFEYAGNNAVALEDNMLGGSLYDTTIDGVNNKIYQMQANNGTVKFYWMYAEYNQAGELTNAGTDNGGYVKLPANKAYFSMLKSEGASSYSFRFPWEGTTDIEGIVTEDNDALNGTIFDLQGRKIVEITEPGFYIINGKKVFVEEIK